MNVAKFSSKNIRPTPTLNSSGWGSLPHAGSRLLLPNVSSRRRKQEPRHAPSLGRNFEQDSDHPNQYRHLPLRPKSTLYWNFCCKDKLSGFFFVFICLFLPLVCKLHVAKDCIWLVHCVCRMSCKVPGIRNFSEDVCYL